MPKIFPKHFGKDHVHAYELTLSGCLGILDAYMKKAELILLTER